ncbi:MAG: pyridoxal phosphate-dependent aminotransferase [Chloroflexota bacterium]
MTNTIPLASSLSAIQASQIRQVADVAFGMEQAGTPVLKLQFGESNMPTPDYIKEAMVQALADGYTFYSENAGLPSLRETLAQKYAEMHNVTLDPTREIMITASGVQALNVSIRCTINPGDEVLVLTPNWPNGTEIVRMYGATPIEIPYKFDEEQGYAIDFEALENALTPRTKMLLYTSPSNPLGWVATISDQQALLDFTRKHNLWLVADEVYERIYFDALVAPSILRLCTRDDAVIVVQSFSKSYCMTGWRLGWVISRADMIAQATALNEFIVSHAASMTQRAGEVALTKGEADVQALSKAFAERVNYCYQATSTLSNVSVAQPAGTFYLFLSIDGVDDSVSFALELLKQEQIAVAPGSAFGNGGEGAIRICCASDMSVLEPAMERLTRFLGNR